MIRRWMCELAVVATISIVSAVTSAAEEPQPRVMNFPKGTWTFQLYGTYADGLDARTDIASGAAGVGYFVFDNLALGLEANGYHAQQSGFDAHNAWMYGVSGVLRHHLLRFERTTFFVDVSFGPAEATHRVPADGTYFNFVTRTGIGTTYQLKDNLHLIGGVRYFHLSNAKIEGTERNPSINGVEGFVGLMWTF